jgi:carbon storage regulator CsrA
MLVLSRKEGERIQIGDQITVVISKIAGNRVSIGIEAPKDLKVVRGELEWHTVPATLPLERESEAEAAVDGSPKEVQFKKSRGLSSFTSQRKQVG